MALLSLSGLRMLAGLIQSPAVVLGWSRHRQKVWEPDSRPGRCQEPFWSSRCDRRVSAVRAQSQGLFQSPWLGAKTAGMVQAVRMRLRNIPHLCKETCTISKRTWGHIVHHHHRGWDGDPGKWQGPELGPGPREGGRKLFYLV